MKPINDIYADTLRESLAMMCLNDMEVAPAEERDSVASVYHTAVRFVDDAQDHGRGWKSLDTWLWFSCPAHRRDDVARVLRAAREGTQ